MTTTDSPSEAPGGSGPFDDANVPALLRAARGSYAHAIVAFLDAAGCDDLPQNGPFVLGGMANRQASAVDMIRGLGVTRQAASQLIDTLVVRGYLSREVNPADRRRLNVELTDRGGRPPPRPWRPSRRSTRSSPR